MGTKGASQAPCHTEPDMGCNSLSALWKSGHIISIDLYPSFVKLPQSFWYLERRFSLFSNIYMLKHLQYIFYLCVLERKQRDTLHVLNIFPPKQYLQSSIDYFLLKLMASKQHAKWSWWIYIKQKFVLTAVYLGKERREAHFSYHPGWFYNEVTLLASAGLFLLKFVLWAVKSRFRPIETRLLHQENSWFIALYVITPGDVFGTVLHAQL